MNAEIHLQLPYPPSANRYWRSAPGRGLVPSDEARQYKAELARLCVGRRPLIGSVHVTLRVFRPRATGDLDNVIKVLFDALKFIAWLDDDQVTRLLAIREREVGGGSVQFFAEGARFALEAEVAARRTAEAITARKRRESVRRNRLNARDAELLAVPASYPPRRAP